MGWYIIDQTLESWACESVARGPVCILGADGPDDGSGMAAAERSQCRTAPSEPPDTRTGWTGCQERARGQNL